MLNSLDRDDTSEGDTMPAEQVLSPFLYDPEALSHSCRQVDARVKWRNSVFAVARKMLTEDGYRHFTLRSLSIETNSSVQNIYNNIGTRDDVVIQAILNYNHTLITQFYVDSYNPYVCLINARHKEVTDHPEYAKAVHDALFGTPALNEAVRLDTIRIIAPFARSLVRHGAETVDHIRLSKLLATIARGAAKEWFDGMCSAEEMRENSLADGEICLAGAVSRTRAEGMIQLSSSGKGVAVPSHSPPSHFS